MEQAGDSLRYKDRRSKEEELAFDIGSRLICGLRQGFW
jgi:hypothetical protein